MIKFTKMHGIGNDYVYVNGFDQSIADPSALAMRVADRHFGIGSDGLILILPSDQADVRMRMFNADGSESEMCGNGVRCVAKYAYDHGLTQNNPLRVETGNGVLPITLQIAGGRVASATVDMGAPILEPAQIPVDLSSAANLGHATYRLMLPPSATTRDGAAASAGVSLDRATCASRAAMVLPRSSGTTHWY